MTFTTLRQSLPGYEDCGTIVIQYIMGSGIQTVSVPEEREFLLALLELPAPKGSSCSLLDADFPGNSVSVYGKDTIARGHTVRLELGCLFNYFNSVGAPLVHAKQALSSCTFSFSCLFFF